MKNKTVLIKLENLLVLEPLVASTSALVNKKLEYSDIFSYSFFKLKPAVRSAILNRLGNGVPATVKGVKELIDLLNQSKNASVVLSYEMPCQLATYYIKGIGLDLQHLCHEVNADKYMDLPGIDAKADVVDLRSQTEYEGVADKLKSSPKAEIVEEKTEEVKEEKVLEEPKAEIVKEEEVKEEKVLEAKPRRRSSKKVKTTD